jgi:hypothetical protein
MKHELFKTCMYKFLTLHVLYVTGQSDYLHLISIHYMLSKNLCHYKILVKFLRVGDHP